MQTVVNRNSTRFSNVAISIARFQARNTWSVIPSKSELEGKVRTFQNYVSSIIIDLMKRNIEGIAASFGAKVDFRWYPYATSVYNDDKYTKVVTEGSTEL